MNRLILPTRHSKVSISIVLKTFHEYLSRSYSSDRLSNSFFPTEDSITTEVDKIHTTASKTFPNQSAPSISDSISNISDQINARNNLRRAISNAEKNSSIESIANLMDSYQKAKMISGRNLKIYYSQIIGILHTRERVYDKRDIQEYMDEIADDICQGRVAVRSWAVIHLLTYYYRTEQFEKAIVIWESMPSEVKSSAKVLGIVITIIDKIKTVPFETIRNIYVQGQKMWYSTTLNQALVPILLKRGHIEEGEELFQTLVNNHKLKYYDLNRLYNTYLQTHPDMDRSLEIFHSILDGDLGDKFYLHPITVGIFLEKLKNSQGFAAASKSWFYYISTIKSFDSDAKLIDVNKKYFTWIVQTYDIHDEKGKNLFIESLRHYFHHQLNPTSSFFDMLILAVIPWQSLEILTSIYDNYSLFNIKPTSKTQRNMIQALVPLSNVEIRVEYHWKLIPHPDFKDYKYLYYAHPVLFFEELERNYSDFALSEGEVSQPEIVLKALAKYFTGVREGHESKIRFFEWLFTKHIKFDPETDRLVRVDDFTNIY